MRKLIIFLILNLTMYGFSNGQGYWTHLNSKLKITDSIWIADYKVQYLRDSNNLKIYRVLDINNNCDIDYSGFLYTTNINSQSGAITLYYNDGKTKAKRNFNLGQLEGEWIEYYDNNQIDNKGEFINGKRNNSWVWFFKNGLISSKEEYEMDKLISVEMWDSIGQPVANPEQVDRLPILKKGNKNIKEFRNNIGRNLRYPADAANNNISGTVFVQFCIDENGDLKNARVIKGIYESLDKEALRVILLANKWLPAIQHNRITEMSFTLPIIFQ